MEVRTIKQIRLAKEISLEDMARFCNVHVNTYRNWEKKPGIIPISKASLICKKLEVDLEQVIFC